MSAKRDKRIVNYIIFITGVLLFALIVGIVIFSLPDTTDDSETTVAKQETTKQTESTTETTEAPTTEEPTTEEITTEEPTTEAPKSIEIVAFGDNLLHSGIFDYVLQEDGSYDMSYAYSGIKEKAEAADIAIINEEVPIGGVELGLVKYPNFNAVYEVADELHRIGIDCLTVATNHVLDMGAPGVQNMRAYIGEHYPDMLLTGAYNTQEERDTIPVIEREGIRVAVLDYTYDLNGHSSSEVVINMIDPELIKSDIARARTETDFVIVCMHWGTEYMLEPDAQELELAQLIADAGADLILGSHPHVVQPVKKIKAQDGREVLCFYSLGNLISLQNKAETMLGGVANITLTKDDDGVAISDYDLGFVVTHYDTNYANCTSVLWEDYTEERAAMHGCVDFDGTFSYEALKYIVGSTIVLSEGL